MNPIRILHLTPPGFGGIDSYIFGHYRHMDQQRFRFDFMTQNLELENAEQYQDFSYRVWTLPVTAAQDRSAMNLVAVIGENDARKLFGTDDVVGMSVEATIYDTTQEITMIGVIKEVR